MTEKRYYLENYKDFTVITLRLYDRKIKHKHYDWLTESHKIVDLLNKLENENRQLRLELDTHKHPLWSTREAERVVNELKKENEQLKQRNNRQYEQLGRLYNLIEQKDWRALNDILDDFKRCEEQLRREWKCYE